MCPAESLKESASDNHVGRELSKSHCSGLLIIIINSIAESALQASSVTEGAVSYDTRHLPKNRCGDDAGKQRNLMQCKIIRYNHHCHDIPPTFSFSFSFSLSLSFSFSFSLSFSMNGP